MKDFDIVPQELLAPLSELPGVRVSLSLLNWTKPPDGWDEEKGEAIYDPITPEDLEKMEFWKRYRITAMKHTKPEAERTSLGDGVVRKAFESMEFDSRNIDSERIALHQILGAAVAVILEL